MMARVSEVLMRLERKRGSRRPACEYARFLGNVAQSQGLESNQKLCDC